MITFERFYKEFLLEEITTELNTQPYYYSISNDINDHDHIDIVDGYPDANQHSGGLRKIPSDELLPDDFKRRQINDGQTTVEVKPALGYWTFADNQPLKLSILHAARGRTEQPNASEQNLEASSIEISKNLINKLQQPDYNTPIFRVESTSLWNEMVLEDMQDNVIEKLPLNFGDLGRQIENIPNTTARAFIKDLLVYIQNLQDPQQIYRTVNDIGAGDELKLSKERMAKFLVYADSQRNFEMQDGRRVRVNRINGINNVEYRKFISNITHNKPNDAIDLTRIKKFLSNINVFHDINLALNNISTIIVVDDNINQGDTFNEINNKIIARVRGVQKIIWVVGIIKIKQPASPAREQERAAYGAMREQERAAYGATRAQTHDKIVNELKKFYNNINIKNIKIANITSSTLIDLLKKAKQEYNNHHINNKSPLRAPETEMKADRYGGFIVSRGVSNFNS